MLPDKNSDHVGRAAAMGLYLPIALGFGAGYSVLAVLALWRSPMSPTVILPTLLLGAILVALSTIDVRHFRLPDALTLPLALAGLACTVMLNWEDIYWRLAATCAGFGLLAAIGWCYHKLRKRHGLGLGDAKLFAAAGAWLGIEGLPTALLAASLGALVYVLLRMLAGDDMQPATRIAFGPFLAGGLWTTWLFGPLV